MIYLTDEMIMKTLRNRMTFGGIAGVLFLILGIVFLIKTIKKLRENDVKRQKGEEEKKVSPIKNFLMVAVTLMFIGWGISSLVISLKSYSTVRNGYHVYNETILNKDSAFIKTGKNKSKTVYYFYLSSLGKNKVGAGTYRDYKEGDRVIVVMSKNQIIKMYDASKYEYVGEY